MVLANLSEEQVLVDPALPSTHGFLKPDDRLAPGTVRNGSPLTMKPLSVRWIVDVALDDVVPQPPTTA